MPEEKTKKNDFVEIKFTGYANGEIFDSNIPEDLKKINDKAAPKKTIVVIGEKMVVTGLDKELEDKELNKEYIIDIPRKDAFGERNRSLIKTIPLKSFTSQKVNPYPGLVLTLDNYLVKIIAVSGARVIADLNNPLAGKNIRYKFTITRKVTDEKEKAESLLEIFFKQVPEFEITEKNITIKAPKQMEVFVNVFREKFKELLGKDLKFEEKKKSSEKITNAPVNQT